MKEVALKVSQINVNWNENNCKQYVKHLEREVEIHLTLNHNNIVKQLSSGFIIDNVSMGTIQELCEGPDLYYYIKKNKTIPEKEAKFILKQIISGIKYLHDMQQKIIHYDLKPQNILFHQGEIKITDFGLCKVMKPNESKLELTSQGVGTYYYLPPETFKKQPKVDITTKVDIWSIGVIFYEMLYGIKPFGNNLAQEQILQQEIILNSYKVNFPEKPEVSQEAKQFIERCLTYQSDLRWEINQMYSSSYFKKEKEIYKNNGSSNNK